MLQTVVRVVRRRFLLMAVIVVAVTGGVLGVTLTQQKEYVATSSLLFRDPGFDSTLFGTTIFGASADPGRDAATNLRLLLLDPVATATARRLGLDADVVVERVSAEAEGEANVVSILARFPDPELAAQVANAYAEEYIAFRREADRSKIREAEERVQEQIQTLPADAREQRQELIRQAQDLQVLASLQTGGAELVQEATPPSDPAYPRTRRNAALGLLLALLLASAAALLRERLDRRINDVEELQAIHRRPVLATVPDTDQLRRAEAGAVVDLSMAEFEAFRMLRSNLRYFNVGHQNRSILVSSAQPGEGKTTIAMYLAFAAAGSENVLLIEADLRRPTLARRLKNITGPGLSQYLTGEAGIHDVTRRVRGRIPGHDGVEHRYDVITAGGLPPNPLDLMESSRMAELIKAAMQHYDLVLVDTPPTTIVSDAIPLIRCTDGLLVVTRLGRTARPAAHQLRTQLENLGVTPLGLVINSAGGQADYGYGREGDGASPPRRARQRVST